MSRPLIERMARAACEAQGLSPDFRSGGDVYAPDPNRIGGGLRNWEVMIPVVRAALLAAAEPTADMLQAGGLDERWDGAIRSSPADEAAALAIWQSMISAALAEGQP